MAKRDLWYSQTIIPKKKVGMGRVLGILPDPSTHTQNPIISGYHTHTHTQQPIIFGYHTHTLPKTQWVGAYSLVPENQ